MIVAEDEVSTCDSEFFEQPPLLPSFSDSSEDAVAIIRIKIPIGKRPRLGSFARSSHIPFSLALIEGHFLSVKAPNVGTSHIPRVVNVRNVNYFYITGLDPRPLGVDERAIPADYIRLSSR